MIGIISYFHFLAVGFLYSNLLFNKKDVYFRVWFGAILGNLILMIGIVPLAFIFSFSYFSHILLAVISVVPYVFLKIHNTGNNNLINVWNHIPHDFPK